MLNSFPITRRSILIGSGGLLLAGLTPTPSLALSKDEAKALIRRILDDVNRIINSGKPESAMLKEFESVFRKYADVPIIARKSLGAAWRGASASQRKRYTAAFQIYISRKYGRRFREMIGGKITVTGSQQVKGSYLVHSIAKLKGEAPFALDWQVSDKSGQNKMFNLYIEGISLLATERTEVAAMLDKRHGDIEKLIAALKASS